MNKERNLDLVTSFGDDTQLYIGTECGNYAKFMSHDKISEFCENLNVEPTIKLNGYYFTSKYSYKDEKSCITLRHFGKSLQVPIKLLDHSIYCVASDEEWNKIEDSLFSFILKNWRMFLAKNIQEYKSHFNKTVVLSRQENACIL